MNKKFFLAVYLLIGLFAGLAGCRSKPPARLEAFRRLPANRLATWQVDVAALRRGLIPLPKELDGVELISGVIATDRKPFAISEPVQVAGLNTGPQDGAGAVPDPASIPQDVQFWLLADPRAFGDAGHPLELSVGKMKIELPSELITRASQLTASGHASALGMDLTIDADYPEAADAQRLAPSLSAVLRLARDYNAKVSTQGNHILINAGIGPADTGRLLMAWMSQRK